MMRRKLRSEKGASITFALFIFLVCAVISSVVLVAATASSGRMSQQAETDQRYYSVTSAAELLKDLIDGQTVTAERTQISVQTYQKQTNGTTVAVGSAVDPPSPAVPDSTKLNNAVVDIDDVKKSFVKDAAMLLAETTENTPYSTDPIAVEQKRTYELTVSDKDSLAVIIEETVKPDGTLFFTICNAEKKSGQFQPADKQYKVALTFDADISVYTSHNVRDGERYEVEDEGNTYKYDTTITDITTTTITWSFGTMQNYSA